MCCNQVGLSQVQLAKVWPKFPKALLENGDATSYATSFSLCNRYEVYIVAFVLDETCPLLRNTPPAGSGQIWAGTAFTHHIERTDVMYRPQKAPSMITWSLWRDISGYMVKFTLTIDLISSIFSSCLLFWWSKVQPDLLMLDMCSTAAFSS